MVVNGLPEGGERDRQGGLVEELESLVWASSLGLRSSTDVRGGVVLFESEFAKKIISSSAWNGVLACQGYV